MEQGSLAAARIASYGLLLLTAGLPFHALTERRPRLSACERAVLGAVTAGSLLASIWWALANVAAMAALSIGELDFDTVTIVLGSTPLGSLLTVRAALLVALGFLLLVRPQPLLLAIAALPALASAAWAGHASAGEGAPGHLLQASDILHLGAAALWLGALARLLTTTVFARNCDANVIRSLAGFARAGTVIVATLFVTGTASAWLVSGGQLPGGAWPVLIGFKFALFLAMLGFAAGNRWKLVPEMEDGVYGARCRLIVSLTLETACALGIVALVGFAGLLDPHGG
ncbi:CopD family protein [Novosphingobium resinovorum]|uniref:CopD family protein n=1 Tax=Novosphingobium resinovorum TaxID=158500 RepID=UPI002ED0C802|nr:CopD family protein [Novosphingobium resinovorum]